MRLTIEIDADDMSRIQRITGERKKSPAVSRALTEFLKFQERRDFIGRVLAGKTDFSLNNDQLEARDFYETR
jgi:Arc/MetJ family transcription regulator